METIFNDDSKTSIQTSQMHSYLSGPSGDWVLVFLFILFIFLFVCFLFIYLLFYKGDYLCDIVDQNRFKKG